MKNMCMIEIQVLFRSFRNSEVPLFATIILVHGTQNRKCITLPRQYHTSVVHNTRHYLDIPQRCPPYVFRWAWLARLLVQSFIGICGSFAACPKHDSLTPKHSTRRAVPRNGRCHRITHPCFTMLRYVLCMVLILECVGAMARRHARTVKPKTRILRQRS